MHLLGAFHKPAGLESKGRVASEDLPVLSGSTNLRGVTTSNLLALTYCLATDQLGHVCP